MHYEILDDKRRNILPLLAPLKDDFYLAGGTALALWLGHRDSVDFDFFTLKSFDTNSLFEQLRDIFQGHKLVKIQDEKDTITVIVDDEIKISFMTYRYKLLEDLRDEPFLRLAGVRDIACMKLSAIVGRASNKDYIDLFFILRKHALSEILADAERKFPQLDRNLILKSIVYFADIRQEPILFQSGREVSFSEVKKGLITAVKNLEPKL